MPKKISENTGCNFCDLKTKEIDKLKNKVLQLETQNENLKSGKKQKKEYTEEEKKKHEEKKEERKKKQEEKENEFKKAIEENKKLKNELLMKFGVQY